jgi:type IV fimbrial biogenesis protein FimT
MVEALVVVAVVSILTVLLGPALSSMVVSQQLKNASFDLASSLSLARSEALTRNVAITVTPAQDDWAHGWTVTDVNGGVLRRQPAYERISVAGPVRVTFSGDGRPDATATPFAVTSGEAQVKLHRCIKLRLNGRAYVTKGACS